MSQSRNRQEDIWPEQEFFYFKGKTYSYTNVYSIFADYTREIQNMNFMKFGEADIYNLRIRLNNGEHLSLKIDERGPLVFFNKNKKDQIKMLIDIVDFISQKTFQQRLNHYLTSLRDLGYFVIDECKFFPGQKILFRDLPFYVGETNFFYSPGYFLLEKRNKSIFEKLGSELSLRKPPQFNIQTDTDVVLFLLKKYFGLSIS